MPPMQKGGLINMEKLNFERNPAFLSNVRTANVVLIQNEIFSLRKILNSTLPELSPKAKKKILGFRVVK